ncbi:MAG: 5-oxoprolinase subunit PxpA [Candidatus Caldarchaeum sp.]|nr:5-oxoprolinase subunit PxpA [Candidatus Caldarchaeum sp.]
MSRIMIDINVDTGEGYGRYRLGNDEEVIKYVTSANIATGFHGGDPVVMWNTVRYAKKYGVAVGAHPAFQDLRGFGRRVIKMDPEELKADVIYQLGALDAFLRAEGLQMQHVKPHGALYMVVEQDEAYAEAVVEAVRNYNPELIFFTEYETVAWKKARKAGLRTVAEAFPDLQYDSSGRWIIERVKKPMDPETVAKRALNMAKNGVVETIDGKTIKITAHTLCIHSDSPNAPEVAKTVRNELERNGIELAPAKRILEVE